MAGLLFMDPMALLALAFLPVLWWLLRVSPPPPRVVLFPAVRLLAGLHAREDQPARTPWWILLLRLLVCALAIIGLAHPLITGGSRLGDSGTLIIAIDDGFAAASDWERRMKALDVIIDRAERQGQPVHLLPTALSEDGALGLSALMTATQARTISHSLQPKPWPTNRAAATSALSGVSSSAHTRAVWISDDIDDGHAREFIAALQRFDGLDVIGPAKGAARLLLPPRLDVGALTITARRPAMRAEETLWLRALDVGGQVLARERLEFKPHSDQSSARLLLPAELRIRLSRLEIEGVASASAVVLMDENWSNRPVGLVSGSPLKADLPLLSDIYYLERALIPTTEVRRGEIKDLLRQELSMLILADVGRLENSDVNIIQPWMENGGILVRFAGPHLSAPNPEARIESLLPVRLRAGERSTGGALTWNQPLALAPFEVGTLFAGLSIPPDVRVSTQVLAEPGPDLSAKTLARLSDGTPLVTAERHGQGWSVLVHTTANAEWSNLALSGLFVDMLERLTSLSQGVALDGASARSLAVVPLETLNGFGRAVTPPGAALPIAAAAFAETVPGPGHPPGFYGPAKARRALNISATIKSLTPIGPLPPDVSVTSFDQQDKQSEHETDLKPWFLASALALLILDLAIVMGRGAAIFGLAFALFLASSWPTFAESDESFVLAAALHTRLAYVHTGDVEADTASRLGLSALTTLVGERTVAALAEPMEVDVERDPLLFFPLLYWPLTASQPQLSDSAGAKVDTYLRHGGMILFDTRDARNTASTSTGAGAGTLRMLARVINIPSLTPIPSDHVLGRSYYLLRDFPGRFAGGVVWVARDSEGPGSNDGVSPVIIGGNDWAGAWAKEKGREKPVYPVIPGGEQQREMAYRFGVNLIMYAFTGNYKADQVHLPAIMERLAK